MYSHGSINSDPARGKKSIPIYYVIYGLHYFKCYGRRSTAEAGGEKQPKRQERCCSFSPKAGAGGLQCTRRFTGGKTPLILLSDKAPEGENPLSFESHKYSSPSSLSNKVYKPQILRS